MHWIIKIGLYAILVIGGISSAFSQAEDIILDPSLYDSNLTGWVQNIESNHDVKFYLDESLTFSNKLPPISQNIKMGAYLEELCLQLDCSFYFTNDNSVFLVPEKNEELKLNKFIFQTISKTGERQSEAKEEYIKSINEYISNKIEVGNRKLGMKEQVSEISGVIIDEIEGQAIIGATVFIKELNQGTSSDEDGAFELRLKKGSYTLNINSFNYKEEKYQLDILSSGSHEFKLKQEAIIIDDVVITSQRYDQMRNVQMGVERLSVAATKEIPLVMGENDILKVSVLLPGVQSVGEGAAGFNVRGSPADQNLFYVENIPLYSTSHVFGFFSALNSDAISEFSLLKSNIPVNFGGRLASIFDIKAKEGSFTKFKFNGGISPVSGRIVFEGPIIKEKVSFLASARTTYSNYILSLINNPDFNSSKVFFGDGSFKLDYDVNQNNQLNVFGYYSLDDIDFSGKSQFNNTNKGLSLIWNHKYSTKHSFEFSAYKSNYDLGVENNQSKQISYFQNSGISHTGLVYSGRWLFKDKHTFIYGVDSKLYQLDLGGIEPSSDISTIQKLDFGEEQGLESAVFAGVELDLTDRLDMAGGIRYNLYSYLGPGEVFQYAPNAEKVFQNIIDTLSFGQNERIVDYTGIDYRISAKYEVSPLLTLKASLNTLHQYIFLLSNTIALSPNDRWKLTDYNIKPMSGQQISTGVYSKIFRNKLDISVEGYLKKVQNLVEFKDGANLLVSPSPEQEVLQGALTSYGIEFKLAKPKGKWNGWFNYTYASSSIIVDNPFPGGQINFGEKYNANYDKPHAVNLVMNYKYKKRISFSANVVYATGKPITYPTTLYEQENIQLINYTERNAYRVPDYFRIDGSIKFEGNLKSKKILHGNWVFSVYNLTGRNNAYNVYFTNNKNRILGYKVSIFAQPIFSLSYNFKFGNYDN